MKKQINPTTKAHLIRGAFYLLLLLAVCAIPFALAQRNKLSSTQAQPTKAPPTKVQAAAAAGKVFQSGAPGSLTGRAAQRNPAAGQNAGRNDVRSAPSLPRMSRSHTPSLAPASAFRVQAPKLPNAKAIKRNSLLRSLLGNIPLFTYVIDDGTAEDSIGLTAGGTFVSCNEFSVSGGNNVITSISIAWGTPAFPDPTLNGLAYTAVLWSDPNGDGSPTDAVVLAMAPGVISSAGTDTFITTAIPPTMVTTTNFFVGFLITHNAGQFPAAFDESAPIPNRSWIDLTSNINDLSGSAPIESFGLVGNWLIRADGNTGGPTPTGTPSPTPTATINPCATYNTTTGTGTITPGDTDIGNNCDDCATAITFPFPVSVYGQTFTTANVSSNGSLDLTGTQAPFTHACQVLPSTLWSRAILPYQDDLRTDFNPGCSGFPGGNCGVFTSVTGTAPNRQFNIEWRAVHFADTTAAANFEVVLNESLTSFDVIYGATSDSGLDETSGVQAGPSGPATTFSCGTATLTSGLKVTYDCAAGGASPTPTPTATGSPGGCTINGSLDPSDPTQSDRLFRSGIPQTCPPSTTCAIFGDPTPRHYDAYPFTNTTGATQCVTVNTDTACTGTNFTFVAAYLGSFDPNNICTNWIGDSGSSPDVGVPAPFSFNVDNGADFCCGDKRSDSERGVPCLYPDDNAGDNLRRRRLADTDANSVADLFARGRSRSVDRRQPIPAKRCALWLRSDCHPLVCLRRSRRRHSYDRCEPYEPCDGNVGTASAHAVRE